MSSIPFVDDYHAFRTVFAEILRTAGHTVLEAATIADAEHLVEHHSGGIALLVVEVVLTTANGLQVVELSVPYTRTCKCSSFPNIRPKIYGARG